MIKRTTLPFGIILLLTSVAWGQVPVPAAPGQSDAIKQAINEDIYRQANLIRLRATLEQARGAEARHDSASAGQLYSAAWDLVLKIGLPPSAPETEQTRRGLVAVHLELAHQAQ